MNGQLLDTGVVTAYLRGRRGAVTLVQPWIDEGSAATSRVVYGEVIEYFKGLSDFPRRQAVLRALLRQVRAYGLTFPIMEQYADLRGAMRPPHGLGLIGDMDTLIAATAHVNELTVVTIDTDFTRVPSLSVSLVQRSTLLS